MIKWEPYTGYTRFKKQQKAIHLLAMPVCSNRSCFQTPIIYRSMQVWHGAGSAMINGCVLHWLLGRATDMALPPSICRVPTQSGRVPFAPGPGGGTRPIYHLLYVHRAGHPGQLAVETGSLWTLGSQVIELSQEKLIKPKYIWIANSTPALTCLHFTLGWQKCLSRKKVINNPGTE